MAQSSGQFSGSIHGGNQQLIVQWTSVQHIDTNKTTITANMYLKSSGGLSIGTRNNTTTIDGTVKNYTSDTISRGSGFNVLVGTVTQDVSHNSDGTKTFSMSSVFNIQATLGGTYYANITANSGNIELPTIPRASSITVNDANIGSATNIVINKTSSNFKTTLYYKASGQNSWTKIVDKTSNQVYGWTVPTSFYALIPNSKNITCQFKAETYNGDTLLGTSDIVTATFTATGNPTINSFTAVDINEVTVDLTGDNTKMIKGVSTIRATVSASAQNSANISSIKVNGITAVNNKVDFNNASTNSFEVIVTDTRGYSTSQTITIPMVNYVPLTLNPTIVRDTPTNEKINISFNGNYYNDSFGAQNNTLTVQYRYKESTSSTWGNWTTISNTKNGNTYSGSTQLSNMNYQKVYNFEMRATDKIGTKSVNGITVSKGEPVYWWDEDEFHINGIADAKKIYTTTLPQTLPSGNGTSADYWCSLKNGIYFHTNSDNVSNMPSSWGFVVKDGHYSPNSKGDFTVMYYTQSTGRIYRTSGNGSSTTVSWSPIAYTSDIPTVPTKMSDFATVLYDGIATNGNVTLSQNASNFNYLVIYYGNNNGDNRKAEIVYSPNGKTTTLTMNTYYQESSSNFYHYYYSKRISIIGTTITDVQDWELRMLNRTINNVTQDKKIYIYRVEGYK